MNSVTICFVVSALSMLVMSYPFDNSTNLTDGGHRMLGDTASNGSVIAEFGFANETELSFGNATEFGFANETELSFGNDTEFGSANETDMTTMEASDSSSLELTTLTHPAENVSHEESTTTTSEVPISSTMIEESTTNEVPVVSSEPTSTTMGGTASTTVGEEPSTKMAEEANSTMTEEASTTTASSAHPKSSETESNATKGPGRSSKEHGHSSESSEKSEERNGTSTKGTSSTFSEHNIKLQKLRERCLDSKTQIFSDPDKKCSPVFYQCSYNGLYKHVCDFREVFDPELNRCAYFANVAECKF